MYSILKSVMNGNHDGFQSDTTAASPNPSPTDPWLFTDPLAREIYQRQGRLGILEEDIRDYVMFDGQWAAEDLETKFEIRRLLREGLLIPRDSFGYLSPHPTTYHAAGEGELKIAGQRFSIEAGDDLVFESWLARVAHPALAGPVWVGRLHQITGFCLCCEAFPHVCIHCEKTLAIMRQILNYRNNGK